MAEVSYNIDFNLEKLAKELCPKEIAELIGKRKTKSKKNAKKK